MARCTAMVLARGSTTCVPSPHTSQRSLVHATGVVTVTPSERAGYAESSFWTTSWSAKLETRSVAVPWVRSASPRHARTSALARHSSAVVAM